MQTRAKIPPIGFCWSGSGGWTMPWAARMLRNCVRWKPIRGICAWQAWRLQGDLQVEAEVLSQGVCGESLLRGMSPYLT